MPDRSEAEVAREVEAATRPLMIEVETLAQCLRVLADIGRQVQQAGMRMQALCEGRAQSCEALISSRRIPQDLQLGRDIEITGDWEPSAPSTSFGLNVVELIALGDHACGTWIRRWQGPVTDRSYEQVGEIIRFGGDLCWEADHKLGQRTVRRRYFLREVKGVFIPFGGQA